MDLVNEQRQAKSLAAVAHEIFEALMDRFEKEAFFRTRSSLSPSRGLSVSIDDDAVCAICMDGECQNANVILFCDLCNLAVHQVSCVHIFAVALSSECMCITGWYIMFDTVVLSSKIVSYYVYSMSGYRISLACCMMITI